MTSLQATAPAVRRRFSADEYERMIAAGILAEDERLELIDGEIRPMSSIGSRHAACVKRLIAVLTERLGRQVIIGAQDPIRLSDDTEPQADITVLRPRDDFYAGALPCGRDVLLVVEVADASLGFDREVKLPHYAAAGIGVAWLVDLNHDVIERHARPMHGRYAEVVTLQRGETLHSPALDLSVRVEEIIG
ncbi:MAG: Uma2 family endonuclease [Chloroflexi bacterium]|uniref:Uma2 family endonuclease n=2 Tax=Candidatus Thermofonsia Clade 3 TaxID=2364209 RepID=A0A2M8QFT4_9CHLR|nr:MAG: Uma2 family endonuclease [Candidatus Thermofonsia Clade 3 bacterium]RMG63290.1 MAG: Uma2 family endonuclease [Chloroflexota bacterium]